MSQQQIQTSSISVLPERAGNVFKAEDVITFHLSANEIPLLNSKETFLRFYAEMTGNCKCQLDSRAAASAVIESMTILTGDQSTTIEQIDDYATYLATHHHYNSTLGLRNKRAVEEGQSPNDDLNSLYFSMPTSGSQLGSPLSRKVECLVPLYLSGVLYGKAFPVAATSGLVVKIYLSSAKKAIYAYSSTGYVDSAGQRFALAATLGAGAHTTIDISSAGVPAGAIDAQLYNVPYCVGQTIALKDNSGITQEAGAITGISQLANQNIQLSFASFTIAVPANAGNFLWGNTSSFEADYNLSNVELICGVISPPKGYFKAMMKKMSSDGGLAMDIKSFNLYRNNVDAGQTVTQVLVPTTEERALSIVETFINPNFSFTTSSYLPAIDTFENYQYVLRNKNVPNQRVDCSRYSSLIPDDWNAQQIAELTKSLDRAKVAVMREDSNKEHFCIGRRLATDGYSCDIKNNDVRVNLQFKAPTVNKLMNSRVYHIRKLEIKPGAVNVVY